MWKIADDVVETRFRIFNGRPTFFNIECWNRERGGE